MHHEQVRPTRRPTRGAHQVPQTLPGAPPRELLHNRVARLPSHIHVNHQHLVTHPAHDGSHQALTHQTQAGAQRWHHHPGHTLIPRIDREPTPLPEQQPVQRRHAALPGTHASHPEATPGVDTLNHPHGKTPNTRNARPSRTRLTATPRQGLGNHSDTPTPTGLALPPTYAILGNTKALLAAEFRFGQTEYESVSWLSEKLAVPAAGSLLVRALPRDRSSRQR